MNEASFRELISGERRGFVPALTRCGLYGLSWFYRCGMRVRNEAFDFRLRRIHAAPVPVVSVGNITAGGTGKTPFVAYLARRFREKGVRVVLLSRGYGAGPGEFNDEKRVLDQLCPEVPHLQNPDRVESVQTAVEEHAAELLILDDGFQHRRLGRDLDIVLIDSLNPWGYGHLLPRGLLREPLSSLRRADLVVLTRADQAPPAWKQHILQRIHEVRDDLTCIEVAYPPRRLVNSKGESHALSSLSDRRVAAFCGIGNPYGFLQMLADLGYLVEVFEAFPDHHRYTPEELADLGREAKRQGLAALVTTQKDLVKISESALADCPLWAVQIEARILQGHDLLEQQLAAIC